MSHDSPNRAGQFEEFRRQLLDRRYHLLSQVARGEMELLELATNVEPDMVEEGQEQALAWLVERLDERGQAEIDSIERALVRLDLGGYGVCQDCANDIPRARLRAMPTTDRCVDCAAARESSEAPTSRGR